MGRKFVVISNRQYSNEWYHTDKDSLNNLLGVLQPETVYFPFWSWIIPNDILKAYRCVGFHTGVLPNDKGGSPIQNLIMRGDEQTEVNAILLNSKIDGGKVLLREKVSLCGTLEEILIRESKIIMEMIDELQKTR